MTDLSRALSGAVDRSGRPQRPLLRQTGHVLLRFAVYVLLIDLSFVFLYPFLYMLSTSLKSYDDLHDLMVGWIPTALHWDNYRLAAKAMDLGSTVKNSVLVTVAATLGHVLSCSFIGYGFARFDFPFKRGLFFGVLLSATIPVQTMIVPLYIVYHDLGMLNTFWPLILPAFFGFGLRGGVFVYLFRQFFYGFPATLEEAARIDGCGRVRSFFRIALPSAGPVIVVCTVLSLVWHWNDYYEPSVYLTGGSRTALVTQMLPNLYAALSGMASQVGAADQQTLLTMYHEGVIMAATAIAIAPLLLAYAVLQRRFMASIELTGLVG